MYNYYVHKTTQQRPPRVIEKQRKDTPISRYQHECEPVNLILIMVLCDVA